MQASPSTLARAGSTVAPTPTRTGVQSDTFLVTVRGMYGKIDLLVGEPGIAVSISVDKRCSCLVLVKDLGELNSGQSSARGAQHLVGMVGVRLRHLFPNLYPTDMRWFDVTKLEAPTEWEVGSAHDCTFVFLHSFDPFGAVNGPQRDFRTTSLYEAASAELAACISRANRLSSISGR